MTCRFCGSELTYVHGHGVCLRKACLLYGLNEAPCCEGDRMNLSVDVKQDKEEERE